MATRQRVNKESSSDDRPRSRPATTPEAREQQLIASAIGSASAQVITHYLKLGSSREQLEQERLRNENQLTQAKIEAMASAQRVEELYKAALGAMKSYSSGEPLHMEIDVDEE
jgi:hypothetical protein